MTDNYFDQFDDAAAPSAASTFVKGPENFFDETSGEAPANPGANETVAPQAAPGRSWHNDLVDGVSITNARDAAIQLTKAERLGPKVDVRGDKASFWGAMEHQAGNGNLEAYADTMEHLADMSGDAYWRTYGKNIRESLEKDKSSYQPVFESFKQIGGLKDVWGYTKERAGQMIGGMLPSIAGGTLLGAVGATQGELVGGKYGAAVGGAAGAVTGAALGTIHLHISDMRQALKKEGVAGENLPNYTNMGTAILVSLDAVFPAYSAMKLGGFARKAVADKVAQKLMQNLAEGGKMRTAAEFVKIYGKEIIKDAVLLEVPTELAQQAVTDFGGKVGAGKPITQGDLVKFATETAPEVVLSTIIGAGAMSLPGSGAKAYRDVRDAKAAAVVPGEKPSSGEAGTEGEPLVQPEMNDGRPVTEETAMAQQPPAADASKSDAPPADVKKDAGILEFIRANGGLAQDGELDALDAGRYPGLVSPNGLPAEEMRTRLVEAGFIEETGPDQPDISSAEDVYDLVSRAMAGERIVPLEARSLDEDFSASVNSNDQMAELNHAEKLFVMPALAATAEEAGDPVMTQAYNQLQPEERMEVIDRARQGEDVVVVMEEVILRNVNSEMAQAMVAAYGPNPELIERLRMMIAKQQPDLLVGFDEMVANFPVRRPKVPRQPVRKAGEEPSALVKSMGARLKAIANDQQTFDLAMSEMERDRKILKADAYEIATSFLGYAPKKTGTKASYFQAIRNAQKGPQRALSVKSMGATRQTDLTQGALVRQAAAASVASTLDGAFADDMDATRARLEGKSQSLRALDEFQGAANDLQREIQNGSEQIRSMAQAFAAAGLRLEEIAETEGVKPSTVKLVTQHAKAAARQLPVGERAEKPFSQSIQEIANGLSTPPFADRVAIAQVYDAYAKGNPEAGSLEKFKAKLIENAKSHQIDLGRLDLPERMERSLRERSAAMWGRDEVHTVIKRAPTEAAETFGTTQDSGAARSVTPEINRAAPEGEVSAPGSQPVPSASGVSGLARAVPAVDVRHSVQPGAIVSLIDGSRHTDLRKHLKEKGVEAEDYGRHFRLGDDYPLVAPNRVAEAHNETRQTEDYDTFAKRYTIGAEKMKGVEQVQEAIKGGDSTAFEGAIKKLNKRRLAEMAVKLGIKDKNPAKAIVKRFVNDFREAKKAAHIHEIMDGSDAAAAQGQKRSQELLTRATAEFMAAVDPNVAATPATEAAAPAAPPRNLTAELIKLANSKTPHTEWAATLGISPHELHLAATDAVQAGILSYDKRGRLVRASMDTNKDAVGIVAEFEQMLSEGMPRDEDGKLIPAAVKNWEVRARQLVEHIKRIPLADAQKIAAKLAGRQVSKSEIASRPKIAEIVSRRLLSLADSRYKAMEMAGKSAAMIAPGRLANENVILTDEAMSKADALQDAVDQALADILPAQVRVDVVDSIAIARLAREDELLSLRSSRSDTLAEATEESANGSQDDGGSVGAEGDGASGSGSPAGTAATRGGNAVASGTKGEGRILRQESATLRADGSIIAGRRSNASRDVDGRRPDDGALQPVGAFERFGVDGFHGVVSAADVKPHAELAERNARPSEYRLATLTYRLYDEAAPLTDSMLTPNFRVNFAADGKAHAPLIWARVSQHMDGTWEVSMVQRLDEKNPDRKKGLAGKLYAAIEKDLGIHMSPSGLLSEEGYAMWKKRSPESVKWHQWSDFEGSYISPRRIKDNLDAIGRELKAIAARVPTTKDQEVEKQLDLNSGRKERGELIKMWTKMPAEARAATPTMFSLRGFYSPALRAAEALKQDRGSGEQFLKAIMATPGVKGDELDWIGLAEFLESKKSISKYELMAWIKANQTVLHEVTRSEKVVKETKLPKLAPVALAEFKKKFSDSKEILAAYGEDATVWKVAYRGYEDHAYYIIDSGGAVQDYNTYWDMGQDALLWVGRAASGAEARQKLDAYHQSRTIRTPEERGLVAKFSGYKIDGGSDYKETLIRLPTLLGREPTKAEAKAVAKLKAELERLDAEYANGVRGEAGDAIRKKAASINRRMQHIEQGYTIWESPHFEDQEIVHIRFDTRVLPDGRRVLFIHEIQSDLHQRARKAGYQSESIKVREARYAAVAKELDQVYAQLEGMEPDWDSATESEVDAHVAVQNRMEALQLELGLLGGAPFPNAPFKGDLNMELALKRMLQYAVEGGYDGISWARSGQIAAKVGQQQSKLAEQYDNKFRRFYDKYAGKWGGKVTRQEDITDKRAAGSLAEAISQDMMIAVQAADTMEMPDAAEAEIREVIGALQMGMELSQLELLIANVISPEARDAMQTMWESRTRSLIQQGMQAKETSNEYLAITDGMRSAVAQAQPLYSLPEGDGAPLGRTDPYGQAIEIGANAIEQEARASGRSMREVAKTAARHEALEFFLAHNIITPEEWSALVLAAQAERWIDQTGVRGPYTLRYGSVMGPNQLSELITKEAVMEMYGRYRAEQYKPKGIVAKVFKRISSFLEAITNKLKGNGFTTWESIFQKVDAGEMKRRFEEIYGTGPVNQSAIDAVLAASEQSQPMIRAGVVPDVQGISQTPGAQAPARPQSLLQRARILPADRPLRGISELMNQARAAAGLTKRTGRIDPVHDAAARAAGQRHALGQYNGVARTRIHVDFDAFAHEMGHHIQRQGGAPLAALMVANTSELMALSTPGPMALNEGFAEFFRRYLTNETAARQHAPNFYRGFEAWLNANNPNLYAELNDVQTEYERFLLGDPVERGAAQQTVLIREPGAIRQYLSDASRDGFVPTTADRLHWMYHGLQQKVFDKHHGWMLATRTLLQEISQRTGARQTLRVFDNANKLIRKVSHTNAWAMQDLKEGIALESRPNGGGTSMHQVLARAFGGASRSEWNEGRLRDFGNYLVARRAVHLYVRFNPAFRTQITQFVAANPQLAFLLQRLPTNLTSEMPRAPTAEPLYEHLNALVEHERRNPQFRAAAELYYDFNKDLIQLLHEKHLITTEERDEYIKDRDYAPFQRNMDDREGVEGDREPSRRAGRDRATINKHDVYRRIEGSVRDIINPIQSTVQTIYEVRLRAAVNDTLRAMDRLARQAGPAGNEILERVPAHEARAMEVEIRQALRQAAIAAGMSPTDTAIMLANVESQIGPNAVTTMFAPQLASEKGEKIVWFYENGKPIPAQLPDGELGRMMYEGLTAVGQRNMGMLMEAMTTTAAMVRTGVTIWPSFIFRNILVDAVASWVNSPHARPFLTQAAGAREILRGGEYMHLYNRYGGMMGGLATNAISDQSIERDIDALRERGFVVRRPRGLRDLLKLAFQVGEFSETATRVGIFRNAMRSAQADGLSDFEAAIEAGHAAHDVMDFSKHGSKTEWIRRIIPFWNAALIGMKKYANTLTGTNDYGNLIDIWYRQSQGLPLSQNEQRARGQATKAWMISVAILGPISLGLAMLGEDDDDMKEVPDSIRATHWRVSVDGVLWLLPKSFKGLMGIEEGDSDVVVRIPKPFEMAWFANAVERAWDGIKQDDPRAAAGMISDMFATVIPPYSVPALDIAYGWIMGKDMYSGNDIVPFYEKGNSELERTEQFGPYTTWTARQLGKALNISPYYADFLVRNLFATAGTDSINIADSVAGMFTDVPGPSMSAAEYPVARRFTYNAGRSSQSLSKFYGLMTDGEGMKQWFWNLFTEDARSFHSAANTYKTMIERGGEDNVQATEFLNRINPDQRAYAILSNDFKGEIKGKLRNLHPMVNASEGVRVTNNIMKEVVQGRVTVGKDTKNEEAFKKLDRNQMRDLRNELGHVRRGIAQNAMKIMGVEGWANQGLMDVDARMKVIKDISPEVHDELLRRLSKEKFQDGKHLMKVWPEVKKRIESDRKDAVLSDLFGLVVGK